MAKFKKGDRFGTTQSAKYEVLSGPHKGNNDQHPLYTVMNDRGYVELKNESFLASLEED
jgi:hypothetical protein